MKYDLSEGLHAWAVEGDLRYCDRHQSIEQAVKCTDCGYLWFIEWLSEGKTFDCECCGKEFVA